MPADRKFPVASSHHPSGDGWQNGWCEGSVKGMMRFGGREWLTVGNDRQHDSANGIRVECWMPNAATPVGRGQNPDLDGWGN